MANVLVQDGAGVAKYLKATGDGSNGDPFVVQHLETNSAAIKTAVETLDDVVVAEDAAHASGAKGVMALAVRQDTGAALAGTAGDYQPLITDAKGALHTRGAGIQSGALTVTKQLVLGAAAALPASPAAGRRNVRISHAGQGGRLWVGGSGVTVGVGLQVLPTHPPLDFPVDGGQIYGISESWTLAQRLGTETYVYSIAYISGSGDTAVLVAGTYPTGQVYRSVDGGCTPVAIMEW